MTTDTEPELTDEEQAALELLTTIPADMLTDDFRAAVLAAAHGTSVRQKVTDATAEAERALRAALTAGDVQRSTEAATTLVALERLGPFLPSVTVDAGAVKDQLANAARILREAEAKIAPLPRLLYTAELAAWRSLPVPLQTTTPLPVATKPDLDAQGIVDDLAKERERVTATTVAWYQTLTRDPNPLSHLRAASDTAGLCREHAKVTARVVDVVAHANESRSDAGLSWTPPSGIGSPAIAALAAL
jgi:hypothetical protein